jgi:hypothetical protein
MMPTRDAREEKRRMQKYNDPHIRIFVLLNVCFSSALGDIDDNFIIYELVCTSIPVSRKKILTITHPDTLFFEHLERARLFKRRPMRTGQIPLSQPVVTIHNSFSG